MLNNTDNSDIKVHVPQHHSGEMLFERKSGGNSAATSWYALHTRRHHENVVVEMLRAKGIETYLPILEKCRRWTYRTKVLKVPLFSNYVFARFNTDRRIDVVSVKGVIQIVGTHCGSSAIPDEQIEAVRIMMESKFKKNPYPFLLKGVSVRVKRGPLKGLEGVLLHQVDVYRFIVCLPVLSQSVGVEIDTSVLECI